MLAIGKINIYSAAFTICLPTYIYFSTSTEAIAVSNSKLSADIAGNDFCSIFKNASRNFPLCP